MTNTFGDWNLHFVKLLNFTSVFEESKNSSLVFVGPIDKPIIFSDSNFVLPIGATVNMDGTSLYQAVAVVFLAQMHMVDLTIAQQLVIVFTATMASIGSAAVPSAGLIMLIIVLDSVGLNPAWISIIFPVDRILDMCRTVVNVTGDATVSSIVESLEK